VMAAGCGGGADWAGDATAGVESAPAAGSRDATVRRGLGEASCGAEATGASEFDCAGAGAAVGADRCGSAGRVVVPGSLKSCNSRGPIVSVAGALAGGAVVAGVLVVAGAVVCWANAVPGANDSTPTSNIVVKRKPALISSRSVLESPLLPARFVHARAKPAIQAQLR